MWWMSSWPKPVWSHTSKATREHHRSGIHLPEENTTAYRVHVMYLCAWDSYINTLSHWQILLFDLPQTKREKQIGSGLSRSESAINSQVIKGLNYVFVSSNLWAGETVWVVVCDTGQNCNYSFPCHSHSVASCKCDRKVHLSKADFSRRKSRTLCKVF